jgi:hypothetical protein
MTQSYDKETCVIPQPQSTMRASLQATLAMLAFGGTLALVGLLLTGIFDRVVHAIGSLFGLGS